MKAILISKFGATKIEDVPNDCTDTLMVDVLPRFADYQPLHEGPPDPKFQPVTRILFRRSMTPAVSNLSGKEYWVFEEV